MIANLVAIGTFAVAHYDTPPNRLFIVGAEQRVVSLPPKLPDELLSYRGDWTQRLQGQTIIGATVIADVGTVVPSRTVFDDNRVSFWIGGGRSEFATIFKCLVSTSGGETIEALLTIRCL